MRLATLALALSLTALVHAGAAAAPKTHVGTEPEDLVTLDWGCNVGTPTRILINGDRVEDFEIPARRALVITDLEFTVQTSALNTGLNYVLELQMHPASGPVTPVYLAYIPISQTRGYLSDHLTAGLVLDSSVALDNEGATPNPQLLIFGVQPGDPAGVPNCNAILRGYLINQ